MNINKQKISKAYFNRQEITSAFYNRENQLFNCEFSIVNPDINKLFVVRTDTENITYSYDSSSIIPEGFSMVQFVILENASVSLIMDRELGSTMNHRFFSYTNDYFLLTLIAQITDSNDSNYIDLDNIYGTDNQNGATLRNFLNTTEKCIYYVENEIFSLMSSSYIPRGSDYTDNDTTGKRIIWDWENSFTTTDNGTNIQQNIGNVILTFTPENTEPTLVNGGGFGGTQGIVVASQPNENSVTLSFSKPVNIESLFVAHGNTTAPIENWIFTPVGGDNSVIIESPQTELSPTFKIGKLITLNWDDITEFTITSEAGLSQYVIDQVILKPIEIN